MVRSITIAGVSYRTRYTCRHMHKEWSEFPVYIASRHDVYKEHHYSLFRHAAVEVMELLESVLTGVTILVTAPDGPGIFPLKRLVSY
jgi:hypothetical protein